MDKDSQGNYTQAILEIFQQHKLKVTPQRIAIYQELLNSGSHPSADAIYQLVTKEHPHISFDTVNRTLLTFSKIGIVDTVEGFGGAKRFDPDVSSHHHLHCIQCGEIFDFKSRTYDNLEVPGDVGENFKVIGKRVVLRGICSACLE
jgi:Fur family peroxide stress response transcriptional regulator